MSEPAFYSCARCPAYCCSYAHIPVTERDLARLARGHGLAVATARRRFTKRGDDETPRIMRHRDDDVFDSVCVFLDPETRSCTTYASRPAACREYPGTVRCGYYDFLAAERNRFEEDDLVVTAWITDTDANADADADTDTGTDADPRPIA